MLYYCDTAGLGDIMLTCYGSLSRNRSVGVRLGQGEKLADILASSSQVAEGVATAGQACVPWLFGTVFAFLHRGRCNSDLTVFLPYSACSCGGQLGAQVPCAAASSDSSCSGEAIEREQEYCCLQGKKGIHAHQPIDCATFWSLQVLDGHITAKQAVFEIMNLPQIEER